nr:hypothetical protein [Tanacetum cinerariifolium]
GRIIADMDADKDVILEDAKEVVVKKSVDVDKSADVQERKAESQAQIYQIDLEHANKGVVIRDPQETATPSTIIHFEAKSKDKESKKKDNAVKRYQALKRKPQTEAQARKNMMIYLRNVVGFKMDYFKGMTYDDIRSIFEKHFDFNVAFLQKTKEQMDKEDSRALKRLNESQEDKASKKHKLDEEVEELKRHLQIVPNDEDDVYTEATPLALKVPVVDYEIYNEHNKPYFKIKRADTVMSSSDSTVTYTSVSFKDVPFWGIRFFGMEQPDSPEAAPQSPIQTPPVTQDKDEREPMFIQPHDPDYVPGPIYHEKQIRLKRDKSEQKRTKPDKNEK